MFGNHLLLLTTLGGFFLSQLAQAAGPFPTMEKPYLVAPVVVDNAVREEAWVYPRENVETGEREVFVEAIPLFNLLEGKLNEDRLESLKKLVTPQGTLSLKTLQASGLSAQFDFNTLELAITIPLRYHETTDLQLHKTSTKEKVLRPEPHSGYLNFRFNQSYHHEADEALPFTARTDLAENINGYVLESSADYQDRTDFKWRRQDTRLRKDDENRMIRYTLGDLSLSGQGLQQVPAIAGVSVVREFAIQPYRTLRPISATEVSIKRSSIISVYINGFLYTEIRVNPGVFNIRDFPLALGQNNVRIKVRDDLGQEEFYEFSMVFENSILAKGLSEFTYSAGMPWVSAAADRAYDNEHLFTHLYHRYGVTDSFTAGLNFQNFMDQALVGIEGSGVTGIGYLSAEFGRSSHPGRTGFAQRYQYRSFNRIDGDLFPVTFKAEYENHNEDFSAVNTIGIFNPSFKNRYDAQVSYQPVNYLKSLSLSFNGGRIENFTAANQSYYGANFVFHFWTTCRLELGYTKTFGQSPEDRGLLSFNWVEPRGLYSANAYYDTLNHTVNLAASRNNTYKYDDYRLAFSGQNSDAGNAVNAWGEYLTQPASVRLEQYSSDINGTKENITTVGLNTGVAWTGSTLNGHRMAFTQPIGDSFTLVRAENLPEGHAVKLNPIDSHGEAEVKNNRNVVVRDQTSYYNYNLNVDTTALPAGYPLDKEYYKVQPTYRSGVYVPLKFKQKVVIKGRLLDAQNNPLSYVAGDIVNAQGELVDNSFFTNKQGRFFIEGLEPGSYKIVTDRAELDSISVEVLKNENNTLDLKDVVVPISGGVND
ncbi:fimbria/pilus outer membrane usher protein [Pseudobdellovibrio sp. HCB154]|uniref:fimbria/pilus outer membrane usher protein n=1 Tax=Pseudobdellovibrio sp. HCB154 TaxID=3386277 RepID=UPI003916FFCC